MKPPKVIYLTKEGTDFEDEWLWCQDYVGDFDVRYIRADLIPQYRELSDDEIEQIANENLGDSFDCDIMWMRMFVKAILLKASTK